MNNLCEKYLVKIYFGTIYISNKCIDWWLNEINKIIFPRFLIIDAKHKLVKDQRGLVPPADRESLKGLEIPVILQKISESTIDWLKVQ